MEEGQLAKPSRPAKPSDEKNYHKKLPDGRSPTLTLTLKVATPFFQLQDLLKAMFGKGCEQGCCCRMAFKNLLNSNCSGEG